MRNATYVGRVGALAVALGVGWAVASSPGIAWADEPSGDGSSSAGGGSDSTSQSSGGTGSSSGTGGSTTNSDASSSNSQAGDSPGSPGSPSTGSSPSSSVSSGGGNTSGSAGGSDNKPSDEKTPEVEHSEVDTPSTGSQPAEIPAPQPASGPTPAVVEAPPAPNPEHQPESGDIGAHSKSADSSPDATPSGGATSPQALGVNADTVVRHEPVEGAARADRPAADIEPAPLLSSSPVTDDGAAGAETVSAPTDSVQPTAEATTVFATLLSPLLGTLPGGEPAESPVLWVALAAARRELGQAATTEKIVAPLLTTGELLTAAAAPNLPPDTTPDFGDPNLVTGALTGTVGAVDPEHKALAYKVVSGPSAGAFTFNAKTGAFTYTPTAAQRILAGLPGGPQTADFTVTVSDGVNRVDTVVHVPISPTSITDAGQFNTGKSTFGVVVTNTRAYVSNEDNTITVIDTVNRTVVGEISLDGEPVGSAVAPDGKKLFITTWGSDAITVVDTATNAVVSHIDLTERYPSLLAVSPDGKTLYVTTSDERNADEFIPTITKISTTTNKVIGTVSLPGAIDTFYDLVITRDGKKVYVIADLATEDPDAIPPSGLFTFSSTATKALLVDTGAFFIGLQVSPDGARVYVNDVDAGEIRVIDTKTNTLADTISVPVDVLGGMALTSDGSALLFVDTVNNAVVALSTAIGHQGLTTVPTSVTTDGYYPGAAFSPDGTELYYIADNGVVQVISLVPAAAMRAIGAPVLKPADPTTGAVTGTVASTPAGAKLTYTVVSGPTTGTLVVNKTTGAFTYTPTAAQRVLAGLTPEDDTAEFAVTAFNGKTTVPLRVTVPIDPVTPAKLGQIAAGNGAQGVAVTNTRAYISNYLDDTITVVDTINGTVLTTIPVASAGMVVVKQDGTRLYVTNPGDGSGTAAGTVTVIDTNTYTVVSTITVGKTPLDATLSPDGKTLYVVNYTDGTVSKISTATNKVIGTVKNIGTKPTFIAVSRDGKKIYVAGADTVSVFTSTATTGKIVPGIGNSPTGLAVSADNTKLYVSHPDGTITVIDTVKSTVITTLTIGGPLGDITLNKDGSLLLVADGEGDVSVIDTSTNSVLRTVVTNPGPFTPVIPMVALSPDGMQLYVTDDAAHALQVISLVPPNAFPTAGPPTVDTPTSTGVVTGDLNIDSVDGDTLKLTATKPAKGTVVLNADGTFAYTPTTIARHAAATGDPSAQTDTFTVTVDDARRGIVTVEVTVDILPANIDPTAKGAAANPSSATGVVKGSITATDKDKDKLTYTATTPAKGTVTFTATGGFTYTPTAAARHAAATGDPSALMDTFTVTVDDGHGGIATVPLTVKISPQNAKPTAKATVSQYDPGSGAVMVTLAVTDTDLDAFSYSTSATIKGAIDQQSKTFTYTPTAAARAAAMLPGASTATKTDTITITINDGHGGITTTSVKISLAPPLNHAPVAGNPKFKITRTDTVTGVVTGQVNITDADNNTIAYSIATPVDPAIGTVVVNTATGAFTFTPTLQARLNAWATPSTAPRSIAFTMAAGDGAATTNVAVTAAITPLAKQRVSSTIAAGGTPIGVAVDASGRLFLTSVHTEGPSGSSDPATEGLVVLNPNGTVARIINLGGALSDVEIGPDGRLYVTDISAGTVWRVDPTSNYQAEVLANVDGAAALAFDGSGHLYVTSVAFGTPTASLQILNLDGSAAADPIALTTFAGGQFSDGLAVGPDGRIYVTSFAPFVEGTPPPEFHGALTILDSNGTVIKTIDIDGLAVQPSGVVVAPTGVVYVTDGYSGVAAIDPANGVLYHVPVGTAGTGPFGITIGKNGKIYVTTPGSGVVSVLTPSPSPDIT